jgi:glycosyltransferase involved in cell wall biosynthesis
MDRLRIAIDNGPLNSGHAVRGVGTYTKELINALGKKVEAVDFRSADLSNYDIIHYPYFSLFSKTLPPKKFTKTVVTVHDLIPLLYPSHYPAGIRGQISFLSQKRAIRQVDAIIADTETSKKDAVRFLRVKPEKVHVVYLAPRNIFKKISKPKNKYGLPKKFVLYVGDINYNKNIPNLVEACRTASVNLVIVGKQAKEVENMNLDHPELKHLKPVLKDLEKTIRLGYVSDEDLVGIYNLATVYCQPSIYEGFGLPVLEAQACGVPVVVSRTQALVEIAEDSAHFFDPDDADDMIKKITQVIDNEELRRKLINSGEENVSKFSWEKTARETLEVYEKA